jgi:hypothetical protein
MAFRTLSGKGFFAPGNPEQATGRHYLPIMIWKNHIPVA